MRCPSWGQGAVLDKLHSSIENKTGWAGATGEGGDS